jgi:hypothetical protein
MNHRREHTIGVAIFIRGRQISVLVENLLAATSFMSISSCRFLLTTFCAHARAHHANRRPTHRERRSAQLSGRFSRRADRSSDPAAFVAQSANQSVENTRGREESARDGCAR